MQQICANAGHLKIFLLGAEEGVTEKVKSILEKRHPDIKIVGTFAGSPDTKDDKQITNLINKIAPNVLFIAYGAPAQELWINRNLKRLPSVKLAMGIGGAFDFISGKQKRAPHLMQKLGLEWLYRLFKQPSRIKRIYNATIRFPYEVFKKS